MPTAAATTCLSPTLVDAAYFGGVRRTNKPTFIAEFGREFTVKFDGTCALSGHPLYAGWGKARMVRLEGWSEARLVSALAFGLLGGRMVERDEQHVAVSPYALIGEVDADEIVEAMKRDAELGEVRLTVLKAPDKAEVWTYRAGKFWKGRSQSEANFRRWALGGKTFAVLYEGPVRKP